MIDQNEIQDRIYKD